MDRVSVIPIIALIILVGACSDEAVFTQDEGSPDPVKLESVLSADGPEASMDITEQMAEAFRTSQVASKSSVVLYDWTQDDPNNANPSHHPYTVTSVGDIGVTTDGSGTWATVYRVSLQAQVTTVAWFTEWAANQGVPQAWTEYSVFDFPERVESMTFFVNMVDHTTGDRGNNTITAYDDDSNVVDEFSRQGHYFGEVTLTGGFTRMEIRSPTTDWYVYVQLIGNAEVTYDSEIDVIIDIKPDSFPNVINSKNRGVIPVAILTTDSFDAADVDVSSLTFGPGEAAESHGKAHMEDVDDDGDLDMMLHFRTQESGLHSDDTEGCIVGLTTDGQDIVGCDAVQMK